MASRSEVDSEMVGSIVYVSLSGALDIAAAKATHKDLVRALDPDLDVVVSLYRVERFDGAGLQLLIAAKAFVERSGHTFALGALGTTAKRALESSGAASLFTLAHASVETVIPEAQSTQEEKRCDQARPRRR